MNSQTLYQEHRGRRTWKDLLTRLTNHLIRIEGRPSVDETFMMNAIMCSSRSTCIKMCTGSIIVKCGKIISAGYNGSVSGQGHCVDYWHNYYIKNKTHISYDEFILSNEFKELHKEWASVRELHGECNAIIHSTEDLKDSTIYTVHSPCSSCTRQILASKIKRVVYVEDYDDKTLDYLRECGVVCDKIKI